MRLKAGEGVIVRTEAFRATAVDMRTHPIITQSRWMQSALSNATHDAS